MIFAIHQCPSYRQATYWPGFISTVVSDWSVCIVYFAEWFAHPSPLMKFVLGDTLSHLWMSDWRVKAVVSSDTRVTCRWESDNGTKQWLSLVAGTLWYGANLSSWDLVTAATSWWSTQKIWIPAVLVTAQSYRSRGSIMCPSIGLWRLALAANLFTVPLMPSQGDFPWVVAKKCHSAGGLNSLHGTASWRSSWNFYTERQHRHWNK